MNYQEILLMISLQAVLVICSFKYFYWKEGLSKKNLLQHKEELTRGMLFDKEIDIEANWILLRNAEKKIELFKEEILKNVAEIKTLKEKTPIDVEKVKDLTFKNEQLGYTGQINKDGSPKFEIKGAISKVDNEIEHHRSQIMKIVMEREYLRVQLKAIRQLIKKGAIKRFDEFQEKELAKKIPIK